MASLTKIRDLLGVNRELRKALEGFIYAVADTAPTDGVDGADEAPIGSVIVAADTGERYKNAGTVASPVWNPLGGVAASEVVLAEGSILQGNASGVAAALAAGASGQVLVGDGTDLASVAISGDVTLAANGAVTIGAQKVTVGMMADDAVDEQSMLITLPYVLSIPGTLAVRGGAGADGVMVGAITDTAGTDVTQEDNSATTFVDETADAAEGTANDVEIPDPFDTSDALYIGYSSEFFAVVVKVGTAGAGDATAAETAWEYWDGDSWEPLTEVIDDSVEFTAGTSTYVVSFKIPADWAATTVDGGPSAFFVRFIASADDVYNTTQPLLSQIWVLPVDVGQGVPVPYDGTLSAITFHGLVASAANNDTELTVINVTQGTYAHVTWTAADFIDRITGLSLAVAAGDELVVVVVNEDGTTEFADVTAYLEIAVG